LKKLEGTFCAAVTPFKDDEDVDIKSFRANLEFYIRNGIHGIVVGGSTGEFAALSLEEHKRIIQAAVRQVDGRVPVIAGTGQCSTRLTILLSKFAQSAGVDSVLVVPPFYSKPSDEEILRHFKLISSEVDIPIMVYNNPFTSKVDIKPEVISELAKLKGVSYIKESSGDAARVWKIRDKTGDRITVFCGADNLALESFALGAKGWVCVAANVLPRQCAELYEMAVQQHDLAGAVQLYEKLLPLANLLEDSGKFSALMKSGLEMTGHVGGKPRNPMSEPTKVQLKNLRSILRSFQMINW
jgi:4-hydroxy-tetrahydrodipicolinate synthase